MNYKSLKLWVPTESIIVPPMGVNKKNICFFFWGENVSFFDVYNSLNIIPTSVRYYYQPTISKPYPSYMKINDKKKVMSYKLRPIWGIIGNYSLLDKKNFFYDPMKYLTNVDSKKNFKKYNSGQPFEFYNNFLNVLDGIDSTSFEKTILYAIDLTKPVNPVIFYKRIFPIYFKIFEYLSGKTQSIQFDKLILHITSADKSMYLKVFDVNDKNNNVQRLRTILFSLKNDESETSEINKIEHTGTLTAVAHSENEILKDVDKDALKTATDSYINSSKTKSEDVQTTLLNSNEIKDTAVKSLFYSSVGDKEKAGKMTKKFNSLPEDKQKEVIENVSNNVLKKYKIQSVTSNIALKIAKPHEITDYLNPSHILNKRNLDFSDNLKNDIYDAFGVLNKKDIPLKVLNVNVKKIQTGPSEIMTTIRDRYFIDLLDKSNQVHSVHVDVPHLTENGTFVVNGMNKCIVSQLVRFPIFFPQINMARFESSYSVMKVLSKRLQKGAYFILFVGNYKTPLNIFLSYRYGMKEAMKMFGVTYSISESK